MVVGFFRMRRRRTSSIGDGDDDGELGHDANGAEDTGEAVEMVPVMMIERALP
jgi:hypothetical protein